MSEDYQEPVSKLLTYGEPPRTVKTWPNYLDLGLTREHVPALIRMSTDEELNWGDSESLEVWAPLHAWRALGQLHAEEAAEPLLELFTELDEIDWMREELPEVFGMIGPAAIPVLAHYLSAYSHGTEARITAAHCLERIGNMHPEARAECVAALTRELERFAKNEPDLSGFLVSNLIDLKATEALPAMRRAFRADRVDCTIAGDVEDVEITLGVRAERSAPPTYAPLWETLGAGAKGGAAQTQKAGRNDPCPCGSGKKYKKCCLEKERAR